MLIVRIWNAIFTVKQIFENWQRKEQCRNILLFSEMQPKWNQVNKSWTEFYWLRLTSIDFVRYVLGSRTTGSCDTFYVI